MGESPAAAVKTNDARLVALAQREQLLRRDMALVQKIAASAAVVAKQSQLASGPYPGREAGLDTPSRPPAVPAPPPRGVRWAEGEARVGDVVDHTLLRPDATLADVERLCLEAVEHRLAAVCVNPAWVPECARLLRGSRVQLATVVGFPFGAGQREVKAAEAGLAVRQGAHELDVVASLGALRSGEWSVVERELRDVVRAAEDALVKVVLESALLTPMELVSACLLARDAGAHYVKTSTGFHAAGGATVEAVALMRLAVGDALGVKASGGVRDGATALAMLAAGATRIGTSAGAAMADVLGPGPRPLSALLARER